MKAKKYTESRGLGVGWAGITEVPLVPKHKADVIPLFHIAPSDKGMNIGTSRIKSAIFAPMCINQLGLFSLTKPINSPKFQHSAVLKGSRPR